MVDFEGLVRLAVNYENIPSTFKPVLQFNHVGRLFPSRRCSAYKQLTVSSEEVEGHVKLQSCKIEA